MDKNINIRRATENDILKVSRLWYKMVTELAPQYTPNLEWWRDHALQFMRNGNYGMFVSESGGRITGFIDFFIFPEPSTGKVHGVGQHFYVIPENRGNCISGMLYKTAVKFLKDHSCDVIELFCFDHEKPMWEKKGYKAVRSMVRREIKCSIQ